jgi:hypothetical protein
MLVRHRERTGDITVLAMPPPAQRPTLPRGDLSGKWQQYEVECKIHLHERHWSNEAIKATEQRFPVAVQEQKDQHDALPINYTIRKLLNYIKEKVSDRVDMQKANKTIMQELMKRSWRTPSITRFFLMHAIPRVKESY